MNHFPSIVQFSDAKDSPRVRMTLPGPLQIGTRLAINIVVRRKVGNRTEEFKASGDFKVASSSLDVTGTTKQLVFLESIHVAPSWKAVKNLQAPSRTLPPARHPRTEI